MLPRVLGAAAAIAMTGVVQAFRPAVTYSRDIAPLLDDRCGMCHHPGGSAPFSLLSYDEVRRRAAQIVAVTTSRFMPPWKADADNGPFIGQHPLSGDEIARLQEWVDTGAVEGDPRDRPAPRRWTEGWQLGTPDLVVTLPLAYSLQPEGTDVFRIFVLPLPVDRMRFVRALEFRPGNATVVHHANIRVDRTPASRTLDDKDPAPGYSGLIPRSAEYPDGHFLGWTPGQVSPLLPADLAWRLEPHTDLVMEIHMQPSGKGETVQPSVGLYFGQTPPARIPAMLRLGRQTIDIPAGTGSYTITDSYVLPVDVEVQAVQPHAHYRARQVFGDATLPDNTVKPLIRIKDWDFRWQHVYRYETPLRLPKGTRLAMRYVYDNSTSNARNPEHPPRRARWGQRSSDEMGDLWIQVLTRDGPDLETLSRDFRPKVAAEDINGYEMEIERHPDDGALHDDVAILCLELNRFDDAIRHFRASLALKPDSAVAHYNLGTALTFARRLDEAAREYQAAIRIDPSYPKAHNNLGNVWLAQQRVADAIREFEDVTRLQPDSVSALMNLAAACAVDRQFDRAVSTIDRALKLSPPEPLASDLLRLRGRYLQHARDLKW